MKKPLKWFPMNVDSWLLGSTRIDLTPEQRSVFVDFLALAAKDEGFIRGNEEVPYPPEQIAGFLRVPLDVLQKTIERCIETGKLTKTPKGTLYVTNWEKYQLTPRHVRRLKKTPSLQSSLPLEERKGKERKGEREKSKGKRTSCPKTRTSCPQKRKPNGQTQFDRLFNIFWKIYPLQIDKQESRELFSAVVEKGLAHEVIKAANGYSEFLKSRRIHDHFEQEPMHPPKFLTKEAWKEYVEFRYRPPM